MALNEQFRSNFGRLKRNFGEFFGHHSTDLNSVIQWANQNNMALHEDKFELMVHKHCPLRAPFYCR